MCVESNSENRKHFLDKFTHTEIITCYKVVITDGKNLKSPDKNNYCYNIGTNRSNRKFFFHNNQFDDLDGGTSKGIHVFFDLESAQKNLRNYKNFYAMQGRLFGREWTILEVTCSSQDFVEAGETTFWWGKQPTACFMKVEVSKEAYEKALQFKWS